MAALSLVSDVGARYAQAAFEVARDKGELDGVLDDLRLVRAVWAESPELRRVLESPAVTTEVKSQAVAALGDKAELGETTRHVLGVLTRNRRAGAIPDLITAFEELTAEHRGVVRATVTTAVALNKTQTTQLATVLKSAVGQTVELEANVQPDLIGGMVVQLGSRRFDSSVKTQLERLKTVMKGA